MGQTRPVTAIKLMINNSVEQKLHALQQKKANLAQISLNKLSRKDLMAQKVCPSSFFVLSSFLSSSSPLDHPHVLHDRLLEGTSLGKVADVRL